MTSDGNASVGPIAEYEALRSEILHQFEKQQGLYLFQLASAGGILSFALSTPSKGSAALVIPLLSYLLGMRYLSFALGVLSISVYIADELSPKVPGGFGWEEWQRAWRLKGEVGGVPTRVAPKQLSAGMFVGPAVIGWFVGIWGIANSSPTALEATGMATLALISGGLIVLVIRSWRATAVVWRAIATRNPATAKKA